MKIFLAIFIISTSVFAQSIDPETLRSILSEGNKGSEVRDDDQYESFTQNNYSNTIRLLDKIDKNSERELFYTNLAQSRIELASKLCSKDKRACFLIDEYQQYKDEVMESSFFKDDLDVFGVDIFSGYPINLDSFNDLPLPDSYRLKVGDKVQVQISGMESFTGDVQINPAGVLVIGVFGAFEVAGLTVSEAELYVSSQILETYTGSEIYLGLRSVNPKNIFVLGNVRNPGSYGVNAFATAINALISGGGLNKNSSLRRIKVGSSGQHATLDLYDFLIHGDLSSDVLMQDGDTVLVDGLRNQIAVMGEVNRPALYEILPGETISDALEFALGFKPDADVTKVLVKRKDALSNISTIKITPEMFNNFELQNGDELVINKVFGSQVNGIEIMGAIRNPGSYFLEDGGTLGDFLNINTDLLDNTYLPLSLIRRFDKSYGDWRYIKFDLMNDFSNKELMNKDQIIIFDKKDIEFINSKFVYEKFTHDKTDKEENINPLDAFSPTKIIETISSNEGDSNTKSKQLCLENFSMPVEVVSKAIELKFQTLKKSNNEAKRDCTNIFSNIPNLIPYLLANAVPLVGNSINQGLYPVSEEVNAAQLFYSSGGSILGANSELFFEVLYDKNSIIANATEVTKFKNLNFVNVKITNSDISQGFVTLDGEVKYPGEYAIRSGESLSSIYKRAGGLTGHAYPRGGILIREATRKEERRVLLRAQKDLGEVISNAALNGYLNQNPTDLVQLISLISSLSESEALGRIVTEMDPNLIANDQSKDTVLQPGDKIYIPKINNTITVVGNVLNPITVPYNPSFNASNYIDLAGGYNKSADKKMTYVIYPNGISKRSGRGLFGFYDDNILPGSTIIVPRRATSDNLAIVRTITPILADLSVTAASINAIGN